MQSIYASGEKVLRPGSHAGFWKVSLCSPPSSSIVFLELSGGLVTQLHNGS